MKRINFKSLTVQNFLSIGQEPITVDFKEGLNIISGFNRDEGDIRNAVGKTSLQNSLYFAIFGTTPNEIPKQHIPNRKIGRNCKVTLDFEVITPSRGSEQFRIERSLAPTKLRVWKNGAEKTKSTIPETNKYIKEVLNANEEIFLDCIFMRANSTTPFMSKKKTDKKNFIESIFNLSIFSDMLKIVKDDVRDLRRSYDIENTKYQQLEKNKNQYMTSIADMQYENLISKSKQQEKISRIEQQISDTKKKKEILESQRVEIDESNERQMEDDIRHLDTFISTLIQKGASCEAKISQLKQEIARIKSLDDVKVCPTCGRPFDKEEVSEEERQQRVDKIEKLNDALVTVNEAVKKIADKRSQMESAKSFKNDELKILRKSISDARLIEERIRSCEDGISMLQDQIENILSHNQDSAIKEMQRLLDTCTSDLEVAKELVDKLEQELSKLGVCEFILSDMGVRKFIVSKLLELLNGRISYYLKSLKSTFEFTFDEKFEESIKDVNGIECLYGNCSGAESKKIDLAIGFAFLDILKYHQQTEYNISFYDEILDSSLDAKSLECVIDFITNMSYDTAKCVYVITHKQDVALPRVTEYITLEKVNGFTRRIETE